MNSSWMEELSLIFIDDFKNYYRELEDNKEVVLEELKAERVRFNRTLEKGLRKFEKVSDKDVDGTTAFHLFDTYGFPLELTIELAKEKGLLSSESLKYISKKSFVTLCKEVRRENRDI